MGMMERYAKYRLRADAVTAFRSSMHALVEAARAAGGFERFDWFLNEEAAEAVCMAEATSDAFAALAEPWVAVDSLADVEWVDLNGSGTFLFDDGLDVDRPTPGPPASEAAAAGMIEIFTWFEIAPGAHESFRRIAREMTAIVRERDPGTTRYDWLYERDGNRAIALDTYIGLEGMKAHMANCHDPHEELLRHAKMTTEFLGSLSPAVGLAVSKHNPFILPCVASI